MTKYKVGIVGSYREFDDRYHFGKSQEEFNKASQLLGNFLSLQKNVDTLVVSVSNDHLEEQMAKVILLPDGSYTTKYKIEDTADYQAMLGFLSNSSSGKKIELLISDKMIAGGETERKEINMPPFMERSFQLSNSKGIKKLSDHESQIQFENISNKPLRSQILQYELIPNIDLLITIGGGKATDKAHEQAILNKIPVLPIPYFNAMSLKYLAEGVAYSRKVFRKRIDELIPEKFNNVTEWKFLSGISNRSFAESTIQTPFDDPKINISKSLESIIRLTFADENKSNPNLRSSEELTIIREEIEKERSMLAKFYFRLNEGLDSKGDSKIWSELLMSPLEYDKAGGSEILKWFFRDIIPDDGFKGFRLITDHRVKISGSSDKTAYYNYNADGAWEFSDDFLSNLYKHLGCSENSIKRLIKAISMLMIHESLHVAVHKIGEGMHSGIGDFYHLIEDSDYQADVWAFLIQMAYDNEKNRIEEGDYRKYMLDTLDVAMNTTKAFVTDGQEVGSIEVRRLNRIMFLSLQYARITEIKPEKPVSQIISILTDKPSMDIKSLKQLSQEDETRVEFSLDEATLQKASHEGLIELGVFYGNRIFYVGQRNRNCDLAEVLRSFRSVDINSIINGIVTIYRLYLR